MKKLFGCLVILAVPVLVAADGAKVPIAVRLMPNVTFTDGSDAMRALHHYNLYVCDAPIAAKSVDGELVCPDGQLQIFSSKPVLSNSKSGLIAKRPLFSVQIEAEDYDEGGEGVGYHDLDPHNSGKRYRQEGVDIYDTSDRGGGFATGRQQQGEWLRYTIEVPHAGLYQPVFRLARGKAGTSRLQLEVDGDKKDAYITTESTVGWDTFITIQSDFAISLTEGEHEFKVYMERGEININWWRLVEIPEVEMRVRYQVSKPAGTLYVRATQVDESGKLESEPSNQATRVYDVTKLPGAVVIRLP